MSKKLLPPYLPGKRKNPTIDWMGLRCMFLNQKLEAKEFLEQFRNIDVEHKQAKKYMREWSDEKKLYKSRQYHKHKRIAELDIVDNNLVNDDVVLERLNDCKLKQALSDHQSAEAIKYCLIQRAQRDNVPAQELALISKSLDIIQKIQRTALGFKEGETGIETLIPQAENDNNIQTPENVPTFLVEMNDNGKFKRHKPRQVK